MPLSTRDVIVNGEAQSLGARTLEDALAELGYGDTKVATALNSDFVPASLRHQTPIKPGDRIEIVTARQGG